MPITSEKNPLVDAEMGGATLPLQELKPSTLTQEVPNGGAMAWIQVLGAFCLYLNTW
jgi:hypothetical protein